jgi:hypothetical protein
MRFDKQAAMNEVAEVKLAPANRAVAEHWFSLWNGDALPTRSQFRPAVLKAYLPNVLLLRVVPEKSVTVRLAGTNITKALGFELTGRDWIAATEPEYRDVRLAFLTMVAKGAIAHGYRPIAIGYGPDTRTEEILLPFAADAGSEICEVLVHVDWPKEYAFSTPLAPDQVIGRNAPMTPIPLIPIGSSTSHSDN